MKTHYQHLNRGFNWLGSATVIAKVIDFVTLFAVLLFLTKPQVGVAALVLSIGAVVESVNALGIGEALIQAHSVSRRQFDSAFWFVVGVASVIAALILVAAPLIASVYGIAGMAIYFVAVAIKQPLVGAALVPMSILNRELRYERIAIVNVGATLAAAMTRITLAATGAGTWALVIGFSAHGLYVLIGAQLACPFLPGLRFRIRPIARLVRFGLRAATSNALQQLFKNIDYLLIGWFYGPSTLAIYRVAFDLAMEPAVAVGAVINRTALPVFSRVSAVRDHLAQAVIWSLRRVVVLVSPLMVALILAAESLTALLHDRQGNSYAAAALPLQLLAAAALLRVCLGLLYPVMLATGRPGHTARLSATTLLLLSTGILVIGSSFSAGTGIIVVSAVWLAIYPLLLVWGAGYLKRHCAIRIGEIARAFAVPAVAVGLLIAVVSSARPLLDGANPRISISVVISATALIYTGIFLYSKQRPHRTV